MYWYTRRALVHDVFVEEYQVQRVMRQFSLRQEVPAPWEGTRVPAHVHSLLLSYNVRYIPTK